MIINDDSHEEEYLVHYGTPRHSGRYPWGSGEKPKQTGRDFLDLIEDLKSQGHSEEDIYKGFGMSSTEFRARRSMARAEVKQEQIRTALKLYEKQMSNVAAAKQMGIPESTYRNLIKEGALEKAQIHNTTADILRAEVDAHNGPIDVSSGVENYLGISKEKLRTARGLLEAEGYTKHVVPVRTVGLGNTTDTMVLCPPGWTQKDAFIAVTKEHRLKQLSVVSRDGGRTWNDDSKYEHVSIDPKRVGVVYKEDGGDKADGVIYVREGVPDVSLGNNRYAQVRIKVGDGHYLKGMAMYKDDLPKGVDLLFNTNKTRDEARAEARKEGWGDDEKLGAMKGLKKDNDLPFGALTHPLRNPDNSVTSAMNFVNESGAWHEWSRNISAQALSKQPHSLAKEQLKKTYDSRKADYDEIMALTNPVIKKKLLEKFAESTDASAVHLKAAALERQSWRVILPLDKLKENEIYAPGYKNGEAVALIRYPHGGTFEIPELRVNNRNPQGKALLGEVQDAVGIHHSVAERLSGADFDGDTVLVIPNNDKKIKSASPLSGLKDFDPRTLYKLPPDAPKLSSDHKQRLMGDVSNLITDMTIRGAPHSDIVKAVRHSMVVIDAEKHHLDYKASFRDNNIASLKAHYQPKDPVTGKGGASTLISRAGSPVFLEDRKLRNATDGGPLDERGNLVYVPSGKKNSRGNPKMVKVKRLAVTDDAHDLSSGHPVEKIYADHSNRLKDLARRARLDAAATPNMERIPGAAKTYASAVTSLKAKLDLSERNAPLERQAQVIASSILKQKIQANPDIEEGEMKKLRYKAQEDARRRMGASKRDVQIDITPHEWEAIQAGAISNKMLKDILDNADLDQIRKYATPRPDRLMTPQKKARALELLRNNTRAEVAALLGVSVETLDRSVTGDDEEDD